MYSENHITRLSRYKAILRQLKSIGVEKIYAENLADICGLNSAQVRKDFSIFGIKGNKKGGYGTSQLIDDIDVLLGKTDTVPVIIVGFGNIGKALSHYKEFENDKTSILAAFDTNPDNINSESTPPILHAEHIEGFIEETNVKIAILAVPDQFAQTIASELIKYGIMGILNFTTIQLKTPNYVYVNNIDINRALETVIFYTSQNAKSSVMEKKNAIEN